MSKRTFLILCAAACVVAAVSLGVLALNTGAKNRPDTASSNIPYYSTANALSSQENERIPSSKISVAAYTVREYNGHLAIFEGDSSTPLEELPVEVAGLPEADREKLRHGIAAENEEELRVIVEDYGS